MIHNFSHIHFIGIGGISQSALALIMKSQNKIITGTDDNISKNLNQLKKLGIKIFKKTPKSVLNNAQLFVYTNAVPQNHPDIVYAKQNKKPILERATFLGHLENSFLNCIAISGTHGKTTTTALTFFAMQSKNPTLHIGGIVNGINSNFKIGENHFFITEACEYNKSFLHLNPNVSVITNVECEHMDTFKTEKNLFKSFLKFAKQTKDLVIVQKNSKIANILLNSKIKAKVIEISNSLPATFWAKNILEQNGKLSFDCYNFNKKLGKICLQAFGKHNVLNCLFAIAVATHFGLSFDEIKNNLTSFCGIKRRFEILNKNPLIIHDYAHHPTEIKATLKTVKDNFKKQIICIFQPHTYSRTKSLITKFKTCFTDANKLIILPTYKAREKPICGGRSKDLFKEVSSVQPCVLVKTKNELFNLLLNLKNNNTIFAFLGAGSIDKIATEFATYFKPTSKKT